ncbi:hypothetical protein KAI32_02920 [Candidatus Pacearchaeota archaeon]|nr:hypothetical protein [Candidatus Pacearchaeota archaeon]
MNFKLNKRGGIIGSFIVMFIVTIAIVIILTIFIFGAGVVKKFDNVDSGIKIYEEEEDIGLDDVFNYVINYQKLVEARYLVIAGADLNSALEEVGYEK